jgi:hypothetical protein
MNPLLDKLQELLATGIPVGFCPWLDGEGMLWGRIIEVTETSFRVQQLDVFGQNEDVEEYQLSETLYFDVDPVYAERLAQLRNFNPTFPEETDPVSGTEEVSVVFTKAFKSGEVIRITIPGTSDLDVTVGQIGFGWAEVTYYNDLMIPKGSQWVKIDQVEEVTWRNGRAEADTFLLSLSN